MWIPLQLLDLELLPLLMLLPVHLSPLSTAALIREGHI
jgi:hypothetical protein